MCVISVGCCPALCFVTPDSRPPCLCFGSLDCPCPPLAVKFKRSAAAAHSVYGARTEFLAGPAGRSHSHATAAAPSGGTKKSGEASAVASHAAAAASHAAGHGALSRSAFEQQVSLSRANPQSVSVSHASSQAMSFLSAFHPAAQAAKFAQQAALSQAASTAQAQRSISRPPQIQAPAQVSAA